MQPAGGVPAFVIITVIPQLARRPHVRNRVLPALTRERYDVGMNEQSRFIAVTWNVLAQAYVSPDRYPVSPPEALDPHLRRRRIIERLITLDADLLCLQEAEHDVFRELQAAIGDRYTSSLVLKVGKVEGCALFARRSVFEWVGNETLRYQATSGGHAPLAQLVHLRFDGGPLSVANTHLTFQPEATPDHLGHAQLRELLARRDELAPSTWLFAGDFNALSSSAVVRAALDGGLEESCLSQRPWDTCNINGRCRKIDYLLTTAGQLVAEPLPLPALTRTTPMPSLTEPSDHLPLAVRFRRR